MFPVWKRRGVLIHPFLSPVPPKVAPFAFGEKPLPSGQTATVMCFVAEGDLPVDIAWWFNGEVIAPGRDDIQTSKVSKKSAILTIESVTGEHAGNYSCSVRNTAGVARYNAELVVNGS